MICKYCSKEIPDESTFCNYCGKTLVEKTDKETKNSRFKLLAIVIPAFLIVAGIICFFLLQPAVRYSKCEKYIDAGEWEKAINYISSINDKKCNGLLPMCYYNLGKEYLDNKDLRQAIEVLKKTDYSDAKALFNDSVYQYAKQFFDDKNWQNVIDILLESDSNDCKALLSETRYRYGMDLYKKGDYSAAANEFKQSNYSDSDEYYISCQEHINCDSAFKEAFLTLCSENKQDIPKLCAGIKELIEEYKGLVFYDSSAYDILKENELIFQEAAGYKDCSDYTVIEFTKKDYEAYNKKFSVLAEIYSIIEKTSKTGGLSESNRRPLQEIKLKAEEFETLITLNKQVN